MAGEGSGNIFINCWRSDDPGFTAALYMCLEEEFGPGRLYDMHGNVGERVQDRWCQNYDRAPLDGFAWHAGEGKLRVIPGGGGVNTVANIRSAYRSGNDSDSRFNYVGIRIAAD